MRHTLSLAGTVLVIIACMRFKRKINPTATSDNHWLAYASSRGFRIHVPRGRSKTPKTLEHNDEEPAHATSATAQDSILPPPMLRPRFEQRSPSPPFPAKIGRRRCSGVHHRPSPLIEEDQDEVVFQARGKQQPKRHENVSEHSSGDDLTDDEPGTDVLPGWSRQINAARIVRTAEARSPGYSQLDAPPVTSRRSRRPDSWVEDRSAIRRRDFLARLTPSPNRAVSPEYGYANYDWDPPTP